MSTGGTPLRAGVLHIEELPMASDRSLAYQIIRDAGPVVRDAHGAQIAPRASVSVSWPAPLVGHDHLPLVIAARKHRAAGSSQIAE